MAIGPEKFIQEANKKDNLLVEKLEKEIDKALAAKYGGEDTFVFDVKETVNKIVVDEIKKKYVKSGWKAVEFNWHENRFGGIESGGHFQLFAKYTPAKQNTDGYIDPDRNCWVHTGSYDYR